jgi:hypothetical protein
VHPPRRSKNLNRFRAGCSEQRQEEHGRVEESTRQNLVMAFSNVVRTSALAGVVDLQRASMGFAALLERDETATEFDLGELHSFLVEQGGPVSAVDEVCVFLKSREGRFGLQMHLPPHLAGLDEAAREALVQTFTNRGATSATRAGRTPTTGTISPSQTGIAAPPKSGTWEPPKQGGKSGPRPLYVAFAVLLVAGIVNGGYMMLSHTPPPQPIVMNDPAGLPCVNATVTGGNVICYLPASFVKENSVAVIDAKAAISLTFVQSRGHRRLLVLSLEDHRMIRAL